MWNIFYVNCKKSEKQYKSVKKVGNRISYDIFLKHYFHFDTNN